MYFYCTQLRTVTVQYNIYLCLQDSQRRRVPRTGFHRNSPLEPGAPGEVRTAEDGRLYYEYPGGMILELGITPQKAQEPSDSEVIFRGVQMMDSLGILWRRHCRLAPSMPMT